MTASRLRELDASVRSIRRLVAQRLRLEPKDLIPTAFSPAKAAASTARAVEPILPTPSSGTTPRGSPGAAYLLTPLHTWFSRVSLHHGMLPI